MFQYVRGLSDHMNVNSFISDIKPLFPGILCLASCLLGRSVLLTLAAATFYLLVGLLVLPGLLVPLPFPILDCAPTPLPP